MRSTNTPTFKTKNKAVDLPINCLKFKNRSVRKRSEKAVSTVVSFIGTTGTCPPLIVDEDYNVLVGDVWLAGARQAGLKTVSVMITSGLTAAQKLAVEVGYHSILEMETWDEESLKISLQTIYEFDFEFNFEAIGCTPQHVDIALFSTGDEVAENQFIPVEQDAKAVSQLGDVWLLNNHRLINSSATEHGTYLKLIGERLVRMVFTDPPYNVKTKGHIGGAGKIQHREFVQAAGEMSVQEFTQFLTSFLHNSIEYLVDGAVLYICMDFRHMKEVLSSADDVKLVMLNLCVWCKNNGGMGSYYRSQHELIFVFRKGKTSHINNIELGKHGRYRTNVWNYEGVNTFKSGRLDELSMHPTVKPVAMVADAILDSSKRSEYILDPFAGSGTIFIACEKTGRKGLGIELDPLYVDVAIRRWEQWTGLDAIHESSGETFKARAKKTTMLLLPPPSPRHRNRRIKKGGQDV